MSIFEEGRLALYGVWRIARTDLGGLQYFNLSLDGFWRSFAAAAAVLPGAIYLVGVDPAMAKVAPLKLWSVQAITYCLAWTVWPLLCFYLARAIDRGDRFLPYIIVYNWVQLPGFYLTFLVIVMFGLAGGGEGAPPNPNGAVFYLIAYLLFLVYEWFIAWKLLDIPPLGAVGVEAFNFVLAMVIGRLDRAILAAA